MTPTPSPRPDPRPARAAGVTEAAVILLIWFYSPLAARDLWELLRAALNGVGIALGSPDYGAEGSSTAQWWHGAFWLAISAALIIYVTRIRRLPAASLGLIRPRASRDLPVTVMLTLAAGGLFAVLVLALLGIASIWPGLFGGEPSDGSLHLLIKNFAHPPRPTAVILYVVLVAPVVEELWFRGWLQPALRDAFGPTIGVLATAMVFAFAHTGAGGGGLPVSQFIGGLVFGFAFERTRGLASPILLHILGNGTYVALSWWGWTQLQS